MNKGLVMFGFSLFSGSSPIANSSGGAVDVEALRDREMVKRGAMPSHIKEQLENLRPGVDNPFLNHLSDSADVQISDEVLESLKVAVDEGTLAWSQIEGQLKTQGDLEKAREVLGLARL